MSHITSEYVRKHQGSAKLYLESKSVFPSGVTHDTRYITPFPIFMTKGRGSKKWDVDDHEYIDYVCGHGALILGHSHPDIVSAITDQVQHGTHLGANTYAEMAWGQLIKDLIPSVEKLRFVSSGTEATLMALRLARAYTGKARIVKFVDHFHGWNDYLVSSTHDDIPGIPKTTGMSVSVVNPSMEDVVHTFSRYDDIAAVIIEPTGADFGQLPIHVPEFLENLCSIVHKHESLLIMDEVVTGFRLSPGGVQGMYNIKPDLTTMAKIVAGGLPGGVVGGKSDILDTISFTEDSDWNNIRRIKHPGTFNGNPMSAAAGRKCLELISAGQVNSIADNMARRLKNGINDVFLSKGIEGHAYGLGSIIHLAFNNCTCNREICQMAHAEIKRAIDPKIMIPFKRAMINAGVDLMTRGSFFVSAVHTEVDIDHSIDAFEQAIQRMSKDDIF